MTLTRRTAIALAAAAILAPTAKADPVTAHSFSFPSIDGGEIRMADFAGRPVLVVNTASFCGFTPQYEGLQALADREPRLVVLGVPSDSFRQEADSAAEVKEFCEVNYGITFPMTDILPVKGRDAHPFYAWAAQQGEVPAWNFNKILIGPDGRLVERWGSSTQPSAPAITSAVRALVDEAAKGM
jgi:glutathione peroxidase